MPKKNKNLAYFEGVGRRKETVARVRLYLTNKEKTATVFGVKQKQGSILVNRKPFEEVFNLPAEKAQCLLPLKLTESENRFVLTSIIRGGGKSSWVDAFTLALARAIEKSDKETYRPILKKVGLFTQDARIRERRKVGTGGKARRAKQSPKR